MTPIFIAVSFALGLAFRQIGLPPLVGYLAAGFALSAAGFAATEMLEQLAHIGVLLLLFSIGLKLRLRSIARAEVWGTALVHLSISTLLVVVPLHLLWSLPWETSVLLALALGFSSTVVAAKLLEGKHELRAYHGRIAIGILIIQDLVAIAMMSYASGSTPSPFALVLLGLPLLRPLLHRLMELSAHDEILLLFGLFLAVVGGTVFEHLGLSSELGALVLGALLAGHGKADELSSALWGLKEVFLVGFFLDIGLTGLPSPSEALTALGLVILIPIKVVLFLFLLTRFKLRARTAFLAALSLASYSEFALIAGAVAVDAALLNEQWLLILALTVALSFVLAAPLNRFTHSFYERFEDQLLRLETAQRHPDEQPISLGSGRLLIMGMGRVGTAAYDFLTARQQRVVGLDSDPAKIEQHLKEGRRVLFADAEDPGFWHKLNLKGIQAVLLAMPDLEAKVIAATQLRKCGFEGLITTTNLYTEDTDVIIAAGADTTFNLYSEAGVGFAEHAWETLHATDAATTEHST